MNIEFEKRKGFGDLLAVRIPLFESKFNKTHDNCLFCGQPFMYLVVWRTKPNDVTCSLGIGDNDDFDYYITLKNQTPEQVHEIINWLKDHEYAEIRSFIDIEAFVDDFFGCELQ